MMTGPPGLNAIKSVSKEYPYLTADRPQAKHGTTFFESVGLRVQCSLHGAISPVADSRTVSI
jgi:hypothetical protein